MSPRNPAKSARTVPLPNGGKLPTASSPAESFEESFLLLDGFFIKLGPQIRLLPVPNFGVNICPFDYGIKSDFIPELTPIANVFKLNLFNTYSLSSQSTGASVQIQTLGHLFPKLKSPMVDQNQAAQVNFIPVSFIRHYLFDFYLRFLPRLFSTGAFHRASDSLD
jgi:hypothetical protein